MKFIEFIFVRLLVAVFYLLPYKTIYLFSDLVYLFLYKIFAYRRKIVEINIENSFPQKTNKEREFIIKNFYHYLSDLLIETIKSMSMSKSTLNKHLTIKNQEIVNEYFLKNQSIICVTAHYGNWEYGMLSCHSQMLHNTSTLYLPLTNKYTERYLLKRRQRFGMNLIPNQNTKNIFSTLDSTNNHIAVIMAADQSPSNLNRAIWLNFLNQETACIHGPEYYSRKYNLPIVYIKISKTKRGYYTLDFEKLIENPKLYSEEEITKCYFNKLEKDIIDKPECWLWSHRRWKHKKHYNDTN